MSGNLFIVCAPSGAGKTSLVNALLEPTRDPAVGFVHDARAARRAKWTAATIISSRAEKFEQMAGGGRFPRKRRRCTATYYGTSQAWIKSERAAGADMLLEIDWQGAQQVRKLMPDAVGIFILPPSFEALMSRLNNARPGPRRRDRPADCRRARRKSAT